jgi:hypothetical protein
MAKSKRRVPVKPAASVKTVGIRATEEWVAWVEGLAKEYRTTVAGVIDRALTEWADSKGYAKRPPERTP